MRTRIGAAAAGGAAVAAAVFVVLASDASPPFPAPRPTAVHSQRATITSSPAARFHGVRVDCTTRSEANFPGAFTSPQNLVVGPLVLIGGAYTDPETVRRFGGNKFPLLVKAGHVVTVRLTHRARRIAGLAYGPLPQQRKTKLRDTHRTVTFVACRPGRPRRHYRPDGPSGSHADGTSVTFWSGAVLTTTPACVALDIYVDHERSPRRAGLALGHRCGP
jgi:hypothetical protein